MDTKIVIWKDGKPVAVVNKYDVVLAYDKPNNVLPATYLGKKRRRDGFIEVRLHFGFKGDRPVWVRKIDVVGIPHPDNPLYKGLEVIIRISLHVYGPAIYVRRDGKHTIVRPTERLKFKHDYTTRLKRARIGREIKILNHKVTPAY